MRCLLPSLCVAHKFATLRLVAFLLPAFCSTVFVCHFVFLCGMVFLFVCLVVLILRVDLLRILTIASDKTRNEVSHLIHLLIRTLCLATGSTN